MPDGGRPITQRGLAGLLKDYRVRPKQVRFDDGITLKGYMLEWFEKAFRYIPEAPDGGKITETSETTAENGQKRGNITEANVSAKMAENGQCFAVSDDFQGLPLGSRISRTSRLPTKKGYLRCLSQLYAEVGT